MTIVEYFQTLSMFERFVFGSLFGAWAVTQLYIPFAILGALQRLRNQNRVVIEVLTEISEKLGR